MNEYPELTMMNNRSHDLIKWLQDQGMTVVEGAMVCTYLAATIVAMGAQNEADVDVGISTMMELARAHAIAAWLALNDHRAKSN